MRQRPTVFAWIFSVRSQLLGVRDDSDRQPALQPRPNLARVSTMPTLSAIDLFCGAGGLSLGFRNAGFKLLAGFDNDPHCIATHHQNFPHSRSILASVSAQTARSLRQQSGLGNDTLDALIGGPPCQGFSWIGKRAPRDPRNRCLAHFVRLTLELQPRAFVFENVRGILTARTGTYLRRLLETLRHGGYTVPDPFILDAARFGVPQRRARVFVWGVQAGLELPTPPTPLLPSDRTPSVWDAIGDLAPIARKQVLAHTDAYQGPLGVPSHYASSLRNQSLNATLTGCLRPVHTPAIVRRFRGTTPGTQEQVSKFYRLSKQGLSRTLRAGTDSSRGSYMAARPIHPTQPRCITVREAARLHSYPDWFQFSPTRWHGFRQVGNSVPPLLAQAVASQLHSALTRSLDGNTLKPADRRAPDKRTIRLYADP